MFMNLWWNNILFLCNKECKKLKKMKYSGRFASDIATKTKKPQWKLKFFISMYCGLNGTRKNTF